jgi:hypothetical protein
MSGKFAVIVALSANIFDFCRYFDIILFESKINGLGIGSLAVLGIIKNAKKIR